MEDFTLLPVGKRTRSQREIRDKMFFEAKKRARLAAKEKWKKEKEKNIEDGNGQNKGKLRVFDEDGDDYGAVVIGKEEFLNAVRSNESKEILQIKSEDSGVVKKEVFDDEKGKLVMRDDESDDSLQILGESFNPLEFDDDDDDIHVNDDGRKKEGGICEDRDGENVGSEKSSDFEESDDDDDDDVLDKDFEGKEDESSDEILSSSVSCSVEEVDDDDDDDVERLHDHEVVTVVDDEDEDGNNHHDENQNDDEKMRFKKGISDVENKKKVLNDWDWVEVRRVKRNRGKPTKNKNEAEFESTFPSSKNRIKKSPNDVIQNTLLNSIWEVGNKRLDEIFSSTDEYYLPLKFKFGVEKSNIMHEKTEEELEFDHLFTELDFALQACSIGADDTFRYDSESDDEDVPLSNVFTHKDLCAKGKHYLIQDDEIGEVCKFCSYVYLEIKHVTPDFNKDPFGKRDRRDYGRFLYEDNMDCGGFMFPESSYDCHSSPSDGIQGTVWDLIPGVKGMLYPHQRDGFEFIWKNVAGGIKIDELDKPTKFSLGGCIICHAPGTGKTRLAIVFLQSFMQQYHNANPVIVAPCSMLRTWGEELARWKNVDIPFHNLNEISLSGKEDPKILNYAGNTKDKKTIRYIKLLTWASGKGILGVSYELLQKLGGKEGNNKKVKEILLKKPGILVLDEGHNPRNGKSKIWRVLSEISTKRRVILSGTPFQNNFEELFNTIALVREEVGAPVLSGYYEQDYRRIEELRRRIKPFVHVHKGEILRKTLKGLFHSLIILKPSDLQKRCFQHLSELSLSNFSFDNLVSITSVHPSIFCDKKVYRPPFVDSAFKCLLKKHMMDLDAGVKTRFLVELIKLCKGERVLVFGQFIPPLNFILDLLKAVFSWTLGSQLLYMDGQQGPKDKQSIIKCFNDPGSQARVLLASTKACSEGIHLVGASRVVLLDVVWNPSVERQAISRAYRLGQQKDVFVYHLITSGTLEEGKYQRQATKERLSELMFSSSEESLPTSTRSKISEDRVLEEMTLHEKLKSMFVKIVKQPQADNLIRSFSMIS